MAVTEQHSKSRRKHLHVKQNTLSIDRLSDLPDSVICHILSFLDTRDSVRTSILGKRWRFLWTYVPSLHFESEDEYIINRVILLRKVHSIDTFRLYCWFACSAHQLDTWITFAIMRGVQKLDLCFQDEGYLPSLPGCLFTCKTLVDLRLKFCGDIPVDGDVCLPHLKILHLINVQYEGNESLPHLLSGCHVLEELKIQLEWDMFCCEVSSPTLKGLVLDFVYERRGGRSHSHRLEMNTPSLEYLQINNCSSEHIKCGGVLASLSKAEISFYNDTEKEDYYLYSRSVLEFVHGLCNVESLTLDFSFCTEIVDSVLSAWTMNFRSLTELELIADCRFLSKFLEIADNLEILKFTFTEPWDEKKGWTEPPEQVPTCLLSNLRVIELVDIEVQKHKYEIIRYLLRNCKVLEEMKIAYGRLLSLDKEMKMLKKISLFERGSPTCKVAFVPDR